MMDTNQLQGQIKVVATTQINLVLVDPKGDCVYDYYESDTNYGECCHPDFDPEKPDRCPGYLSREDAKADAKYSHKDKY